MHNNIPIKLEKEPIIDAIIEIRTENEVSIADILPGALEGKYKGIANSLEKLPTFDIPASIRKKDINFKFQPLIRLDMDGYKLLVGDSVLALASKLPYPSGETFKSKFKEIFGLVFDLGLIDSIQRYSMKYVDFIEGESNKEILPLVNINLNMASEKIEEQNFRVQIQEKDPDQKRMYFYEIIGLAKAKTIEQQVKNGLIIDIDTISTEQSINMSDFKDSLDVRLDEIHTKSKERFFSLLTPLGLERLGAQYA